MSTERYTPLSTRIPAFLRRIRTEFEETSHSNPALNRLARRFSIDPSTLLFGPFFLISLILLINLGGVAPGIANILAFLPALASLRHIDRPHSGAKAQQGKFLLDYWVCIGSTFVVEQLVGAQIIRGVVPIWWLVKGMAGVVVWMGVDLDGRNGRMGPPGKLSLNTDKARTSGPLPHPEPSPSPIENCVSALALSATPAGWTHSAKPSPIDTSNFLADNAKPFRIFEPKDPKELTMAQRNAIEEPHPSALLQPSTPRGQLDAFLDSTVEYETSSGAVYDRAPALLRAETIQDWAQMPKSAKEGAEGDATSDGGLSPEFIFDGLLPDSAPLRRMSGTAEALDGGPQAKHKGDEGGWKQDMTLDDLLEMEQRDL